MRAFAVPFALALALSLPVAHAQEAAAAPAANPLAGLNIQHCAFPEAPTIPDGATASEAELAGAAGAVKEYVGAMQTALGCLESEEKNLGEAITPEQRGALTAIYNNGVDQMNAVAGAYNAQVKAFKARAAE